MSLESGRSLGRIASLINIITPAIMAAMYAVLLLSIFSIPFTYQASPLPSFIPSLYGILYIVIIGFGVLSFVGFILFLLAMHRLSRYYNEPSIFNNILYALIIGIVGGVTLVILAFAFLFASISASLLGPTGMAPQFFLSLAIVIVVTVSIGIVNGILYMRSFSKLAERSGVDSFRTAGILYLIGVVVPFIAWIAWIMAYIGYGRLRPSEPVPVYTVPPPPPTGSTYI